MYNITKINMQNHQLLLKNHIEKLHPFRTIAEVGSLSAASKVLKVNQSSLSHTLKALEELLEVRLLVRHPRGTSLTPEGKILHELSKQILHQTDIAELKIRNFGLDSIGILKIGTHETLATHVWPPFIKKIALSLPNLDIALTSGRVDAIVNDTLNRNIDIALTVEPLRSPQLVSIPVYSGDFGFYTSVGDKRKTVTIDELGETSLLTDTHAHFRQGMAIPQYLALNGLPTTRLFDLNSFETAISLASCGVGTCVIPRRNAERAVTEKRIREVKVHQLKPRPFGEYRICASYRKDSQNKMILPVVDELVAFLRNR